MKKRLISMLMAVLMIASLLPAAALAGDDTADTKCTHEKTSVVTVTKVDAKNKVPGIKATVCDACGEVQGVQIEKFSSTSWLTCRKGCETNKVVEVQKAACGQFGLTVSYCVKCGKEFAVSELSSNPETKAYYKAEAPLTHNYDNFTVYQKPTCTKAGWGYVVCKNCGDPKFIKDAEAAVQYVDVANFSTQAAFEARVREVYAMFAAINPNHNKALFVAVTEEMKLSDGTELKPAKAAAHIATVSGKAYAFDKTEGKYGLIENDKPFDAGYTGDKVCPYCKGEGENAYEKGKEINHDWNVVAGKEGKLPEGNSYGKTDTIKCKDCNYTGANYISSISSWYLDDAVAAKCTEDGKNATYCWIDNTGAIQTRAGSTIKATGHHFVPAEGKKVNGHENGYAYVNYEICTNTGCEVTKGDPNKWVIIKAPSATCEFEPYALVPATCNHPGLSISKCPVCGAYEMKDGAYVTAPIPKVDKHVASDKLANVKEATCTEEGYTGDVVCKFCGKVMKPGEKTKMVEHTPMDVDAKAPTCTEPGVTKGTVCKVCKKVLSAQETVPALGHDPKLVNAKDATCTEAGYSGDKVCTRCNVTLEKGKDIKALGHNYVKGVCTRCDAKQPGYNPFTDVKKGPYYDAILWAYCNGVTNGISDTVFGVDNGCTRAQIVTFLYRAAGQPKVENVKNPFTDVSKNSTYYNAIMWAVEKGITTGKTATTFDPNAVCTRGQIVTFLWRYEKAPIVSSLAKFDDVAANSYCCNAVMWAVENGITNGKTATTFAPNDTCTRAQAVTFIYREFAK